MSQSRWNTSNWGVFGAVGGALAASACCTIPLLLVTFGAGGAWVASFAVLEPFRPMFIAGAFGSLAFAGYREYKKRKRPGCGCKVSMQEGLRRGFLSMGMLVTIGLIVSPWVIHGTAPIGGHTGAMHNSSTLQRVTLSVDGMNCDACNITVEKALTNLKGVVEARVTFQPPRAIVFYEPDAATVDKMLEATTNVGYPSKLLSR